MRLLFLVLALSSSFARAQENPADVLERAGEQAGAMLKGQGAEAPKVPPAPAKAVAAGPLKPITAADIKDAIKKGRYYLENSRVSSNGSWRLLVWETPYAQAAVTAACLKALKHTGGMDSSDFKISSDFVHTKALGLFSDADTNTRLYGLAYGLDLALDETTIDGNLVKKYVEAMEVLAKTNLMYYSKKNRETSFQLALLVLSLSRARKKINPYPQELLDKLIKGLEDRSDPAGEFDYAISTSSTKPGRVRPEESFARGPLCELALLEGKGGPSGEADARALWKRLEEFGKYEEGLKKDVLDRSFKDPHPRPFYRSKYYYLFGLYFATESLLELTRIDPDGKAAKDKPRRELAEKLARSLLSLQRGDGSWFDSNYSGPNFGTAAALLSLKNLKAALKLKDPPESGAPHPGRLAR